MFIYNNFEERKIHASSVQEPAVYLYVLLCIL